MKPRRGADHTTMREVNRSLVLDLVKAGGRVSRASIARSTTLAKPTVSAIVDELIADGLIEEVGVGTTSGGRPPILLRFNAGSQLVVGVHVGARRTTVAAGDATGTELVRKELATPRGEPAEVLRIVAATVRNVLEIGQLGPTPISAVGVVVPGLTDFHTGVCMLAPNLGWRDVPVSQLLSEELACPVYVHNAGQAAAVAEHIEGAGVGVEDLALLYAGTGLSAGVISSGRVLHGAGGTAGEIGHCAVPGLQEHCACGKTGCLETVASGRGLITAVRRAVEAGRPTVLAGQRDLDGRDIADAAQRGDVLAREAIADLGRYLGYATSWLINAYSPAMVVVGGGLAAIGEPLLDLVRQAAVRHCPAPALRGVEILGSQLGVDVELRGAVLLAMQHSETYYRVVFRA
ncbi:MAG: ROK family protein [Micromonosporaceae bacterium]|nr:ROK family protein [Micromonosporaceae bacterium]